MTSVPPKGKAGCCVRCGRTLTPYRTYKDIRVGPTEVRTVQDKVLGPGFRGDGFFCTMYCGYFWAIDQIRGRDSQERRQP